MKNVADRIKGETDADEGFYSRKARRNDEDVEKFIRLIRYLGEATGLTHFWKWLTR